jgi:hypothetical protein
MPPPTFLESFGIEKPEPGSYGVMGEPGFLVSEFYENDRLKLQQAGRRNPDAPPQDETIQPEQYFDQCVMTGKEPKPPTIYPMPKLQGRKPHVVLMHGTACNSDVLKTQMRELLSNWHGVDISYIDGSRLMTQYYHPTVREIADAFGEHNIHKEYVETSPTDVHYRVYGQFDWAVAKFEQRLRALGKDVDALIGFSQGGMMAALMAARTLKHPDAPPPFRCVVLLNPPTPETMTDYAKDFFTEKLETPALISKGLADEVVPGGPEKCARRLAKSMPCLLTMLFSPLTTLLTCGPHCLRSGPHRSRSTL